MIQVRSKQLASVSSILQRKYVLSALFPQGKLPRDCHAKLMNKLKNMGF